MSVSQTIIRFPEVRLAKRDAHKLRGYFANLFAERSPLLHNHFDDGSLRYAYPLVQYKVVNEIPTLVGLNEGANLLTELFLKVRDLKIGNQTFELTQKNLDRREIEAGLRDELQTYEFTTLWMALNQENYNAFLQCQEPDDRKNLLNTVLRNNLLSFFKGVNIWLDGKVMVSGEFKQRETSFKGKRMIAFTGRFIANVVLPELIGIGKSASRGFGTIIHKT